MDLTSVECGVFGLKLCFKKTKVMFMPVHDEHYVEPKLYVKNIGQGVVNRFLHLEVEISKDDSLRIKKQEQHPTNLIKS